MRSASVVGFPSSEVKTHLAPRGSTASPLDWRAFGSVASTTTNVPTGSAGGTGGGTGGGWGGRPGGGRQPSIRLTTKATTFLPHAVSPALRKAAAAKLRLMIYVIRFFVRLRLKCRNAVRLTQSEAQNIRKAYTDMIRTGLCSTAGITLVGEGSSSSVTGGAEGGRMSPTRNHAGHLLACSTDPVEMIQRLASVAGVAPPPPADIQRIIWRLLGHRQHNKALASFNALCAVTSARNAFLGHLSTSHHTAASPSSPFQGITRVNSMSMLHSGSGGGGGGGDPLSARSGSPQQNISQQNTARRIPSSMQRRGVGAGGGGGVAGSGGHHQAASSLLSPGEVVPMEVAVRAVELIKQRLFEQAESALYREMTEMNPCTTSAGAAAAGGLGATSGGGTSGGGARGAGAPVRGMRLAPHQQNKASNNNSTGGGGAAFTSAASAQREQQRQVQRATAAVRLEQRELFQSLLDAAMGAWHEQQQQLQQMAASGDDRRRLSLLPDQQQNQHQQASSLLRSRSSFAVPRGWAPTDGDSSCSGAAAAARVPLITLQKILSRFQLDIDLLAWAHKKIPVLALYPIVTQKMGDVTTTTAAMSAGARPHSAENMDGISGGGGVSFTSPSSLSSAVAVPPHLQAFDVPLQNVSFPTDPQAKVLASLTPEDASLTLESFMAFLTELNTQPTHAQGPRSGASAARGRSGPHTASGAGPSIASSLLADDDATAAADHVTALLLQGGADLEAAPFGAPPHYSSEAMKALRRKKSVLRVLGGGAGASTSAFLLSPNTASRGSIFAGEMSGTLGGPTAAAGGGSLATLPSVVIGGVASGGGVSTLAVSGGGGPLGLSMDSDLSMTALEDTLMMMGEDDGAQAQTQTEVLLQQLHEAANVAANGILSSTIPLEKRAATAAAGANSLASVEGGDASVTHTTASGATTSGAGGVSATGVMGGGKGATSSGDGGFGTLTKRQLLHQQTSRSRSAGYRPVVRRSLWRLDDYGPFAIDPRTGKSLFTAPDYGILPASHNKGASSAVKEYIEGRRPASALLQSTASSTSHMASTTTQQERREQREQQAALEEARDNRQRCPPNATYSGAEWVTVNGQLVDARLGSSDTAVIRAQSACTNRSRPPLAGLVRSDAPRGTPPPHGGSHHNSSFHSQSPHQHQQYQQRPGTSSGGGERVPFVTPARPHSALAQVSSSSGHRTTDLYLNQSHPSQQHPTTASSAASPPLASPSTTHALLAAVLPPAERGDITRFLDHRPQSGLARSLRRRLPKPSLDDLCARPAFALDPSQRVRIYRNTLASSEGVTSASAWNDAPINNTAVGVAAAALQFFKTDRTYR